jgi:hypothetical protein
MPGLPLFVSNASSRKPVEILPEEAWLQTDRRLATSPGKLDLTSRAKGAALPTATRLFRRAGLHREVLVQFDGGSSE